MGECGQISGCSGDFDRAPEQSNISVIGDRSGDRADIISIRGFAVTNSSILRKLSLILN
ncbi:hypothetical protein QUB60_15110 [Microcoleus sp. A2-C5]|uniref:hypothetical protein n=1 Tax=unclassified Microcoleus TaxID=2642155 RepID=UPI002FD67657